MHALRHRHMPGDLTPMSRSQHTIGAFFLVLAILGLLPCCGFLYPNPGNENERTKFESDIADYAKNAKEYFDAGDYPRARDQLNKYLERDPEHWMNRLHASYCDYFLGLQRLRSGNFDGGRQSFQRSEAGFRDQWNGKLADSTTDTRLLEVQPWKAAMGIAMCQRALGWADNLEAERRLSYLKGLSREDVERGTVVSEIRKIQKRRDQNYTAAANTFDRLVAMKDASPEAIKNLAELRMIQGRYDDAEKQFLVYLALADATYEANKKLEDDGVIEKAFRVEQDRKIASGFLQEKLDSNSRKRVEVLVNLGHVRFQKDDFKKALKFLHRAHTIQPERLDMLLKMAQCLGEDGKYESAIEHLDQYIQKRSERDERFDEETAQAFRLKAKYERRLDRGGR